MSLSVKKRTDARHHCNGVLWRFVSAQFSCNALCAGFDSTTINQITRHCNHHPEVDVLCCVWETFCIGQSCIIRMQTVYLVRRAAQQFATVNSSVVCDTANRVPVICIAPALSYCDYYFVQCKLTSNLFCFYIVNFTTLTLYNVSLLY